MPQTVKNTLCLYLPTRLRRGYILMPAYLFIGLCIPIATILVGACFIRCDEFFQVGPLPSDAHMQLAHVGDVIRKANQTGRLDIYEGYSSFSGWHAEKDTLFDAAMVRVAAPDERTLPGGPDGPAILPDLRGSRRLVV